MIDIRAGILAITICLLIAIANDRPPDPLPQNAPYCVQPVWNEYGMRVGGHWVPCNQLDRYENA